MDKAGVIKKGEYALAVSRLNEISRAYFILTLCNKNQTRKVDRNHRNIDCLNYRETEMEFSLCYLLGKDHGINQVAKKMKSIFT